MGDEGLLVQIKHAVILIPYAKIFLSDLGLHCFSDLSVALQSNFSGSYTCGTMKISSRQG